LDLGDEPLAFVPARQVRLERVRLHALRARLLDDASRLVRARPVSDGDVRPEPREEGRRGRADPPARARHENALALAARRPAAGAGPRASASEAPHSHVSGRLALWYTRSQRGQRRASGSYAMTRPLAAQCLPTTCGGSRVSTSPTLASGSG